MKNLCSSYFHLIWVLILFLLTTNSKIFAQNLLDPGIHPKFVDPLPIPERIDFTEGGEINMQMNQVNQWLGLYDPQGNQLTTTVWGYGPNPAKTTYPGPTFETFKDQPVQVRWMNKLPVGNHLLPVDNTVHIAHPMKLSLEKGFVPTVTHLHGGHTESASDGLPEAWFVQGWAETGSHFVKRNYYYDNDQQSATLWYHDHALGITRLNVYAGLAGFYLLRDQNEMSHINNGVLPSGPYEVEIVIQDRMFTNDGQLFLPSNINHPNGEELPPDAPDPSIIAEFFGDFILVNGRAWPYHQVEPRKYRFRLLNGSDSRFYILNFNKNVPFFQIGTDNGFLENPVPLEELLIAPGERADVIVDFSGFEGEEIMLNNFGPDEPFKGFEVEQDPANPETTGKIMQFKVNQSLNEKIPDATINETTALVPPIEPLTGQIRTRKLALFEGEDEYGRLQPLLGIVDETKPDLNGSLAWFQSITENPMVDDIEIWEVYNATEDAHPIHLHLVAFQMINRESFSGDVEEKDQPQVSGEEGIGGILKNIELSGDQRDVEPNEKGWKDTGVMLPGEVTRVIAKFDREGRYVWHCHILSHEDHEMMRPYYVGEMTPENMVAQNEPNANIEVVYPNPFNEKSNLTFSVQRETGVGITVFDFNGNPIKNIKDQVFKEGNYTVQWDGTDNSGNAVENGLYIYKIVSNNFSDAVPVYLKR